MSNLIKTLNFLLVFSLFSCSSSSDEQNQMEEPVNNTEQASDGGTSEDDDSGFFSSIVNAFSSEEDESQQAPKKSTNQDNEQLQASRIIAHIQDLNNTVKKMEERVEVLEKAVSLGITTHSLTTGAIADNESTGDRSGDASSMIVEPASLPSANIEKTSEEVGDYKSDISNAIALFNKGEYGSAYVSFNNIDASYVDSVKQGEPEYWIARCWYRLKEYQSAKKYFHSYVKKYPTSTRAPMAKYYLAKIDMTMGLPSSAVSTLQEVIRDNPNGQAAEASRELIAEMNRTL
jgi:TolA-binding protein